MTGSVRPTAGGGFADGAAALPAAGTAGWRRPAAQCRSTRTGGDHDEANRLLVYRQVHHSESNAHQSVDLLLGLNGILVATAELKNPFTGQTVEDAVHQYQDPAQRNPKDKIFARRCLAHFAVDPTLVFVTTRLAGASTVFLPFNQGSGGAGNEGGKGNRTTRTATARPTCGSRSGSATTGWICCTASRRRRRGSRAARCCSPATTSGTWSTGWSTTPPCTGPGRAICCSTPPARASPTPFAWLAHRLADLHTPSDPTLLSAEARERGLQPDELVFHKVVVITDRTVLDEQLQATISGFDHVRGMLQRIDKNSQQLRAALEDTRTKIVITTLQKFPVIATDARLEGKRVAVIVDEAHSSQTTTAGSGPPGDD